MSEECDTLNGPSRNECEWCGCNHPDVVTRATPMLPLFGGKEVTPKRGELQAYCVGYMSLLLVLPLFNNRVILGLYKTVHTYTRVHTRIARIGKGVIWGNGVTFGISRYTIIKKVLPLLVTVTPEMTFLGEFG